MKISAIHSLNLLSVLYYPSLCYLSLSIICTLWTAQALSKSLGMKTFPEAQFYMKHDSYGGDSVMSPAAIQQLQHQLQVHNV